MKIKGVSLKDRGSGVGNTVCKTQARDDRRKRFPIPGCSWHEAGGLQGGLEGVRVIVTFGMAARAKALKKPGRRQDFNPHPKFYGLPQLHCSIEQRQHTITNDQLSHLLANLTFNRQNAGRCHRSRC